MIVLACMGAAMIALRDERFLAFCFDRVLTFFIAALDGLLIIGGAVCLGLAVFPLRTWRGLTGLEMTLIAFGCGATLLSCIVLGLGVAGWLRAPLLYGIIIASIGGAALQLLRLPKANLPFEPGPPRRHWLAAGEIMLLMLLAAAAVLVFTSTFAPPLVYDVTEYHLGAFPSYRLTDGWASFGPMPFNFYARFPFPIESLYYLGLVLDAPLDFAAKVINSGFFAAIILLMWVWLRRWEVAICWRLLAVFLFAVHAVTLEVSLDAYIDLGVTFLVCLALFAALLASRQTGNPRRTCHNLLPAAGLLLGGAMVSKYTVDQIYLLPLLAIGFVPACVRTIRRRRWGQIVFALLLALLPLVFWLGKNAWFYGNPLEPFFVKLFRPADSMAILREQFYIKSHGPQSPLTSAYWLSLGPRLGAFGWLLLVPVVGVLASPLPRVVRLLGFVALAYLSWNLVAQSEARFLLPAIMLLCLVAGHVMDSLPQGGIRAITVVLLVLFSSATVVRQAMKVGAGGSFEFLGRFDLVRPKPEDMKIEPRITFYKQNLGSLGDAILYVDSKLSPGAKLMLVYEARPYLFDRRTVYNTVWDKSELLRLAHGARTADEIEGRLKNAGITHVLVNRGELRRFIEQYAGRAELAKRGIMDPVREFSSIADPENLYPPFHLDPEWETSRAAVLEFLKRGREKASFVFGEAPVQGYIFPL